MIDCQEINFDNATRRVSLLWSDGRESVYPYIWLRHCLFHPATGRPEQGPDDPCLIIEDPASPSLGRFEREDDLLRLHWSHDQSVTEHDLNSLKKTCLSPESQRARRNTPKVWVKFDAENFPWFVAKDLTDPERRLAMFRHLRDYGIALFHDIAAEPDILTDIARWFGPVRRTHFGELFNVRSKPEDSKGTGAGIGATAANAQAPHVDENFRDNIPGISFFHCLKAAKGGGGASIYIDGYAAAERLRSKNPEAFTFLTKIPLLSVATRNPNERFRSRSRAIAIDDDGVVRGVAMSDRTLPPLMLPVDLIEPAYKALAAFQREIYDNSFALERILQPGECAVFDNHRVLHTRRSFNPQAGERWLQQLSVDRDEFANTIQCLALKLGHEFEAEIEQDAGLLTQVRHM